MKPRPPIYGLLAEFAEITDLVHAVRAVRAAADVDRVGDDRRPILEPVACESPEDAAQQHATRKAMVVKL